MKTLTEDIIVQSEPEIQDKNQILESKFWTLSDFDMKLSQSGRILIWSFYNASDLGLKKIQRVRFWAENFSTCQILKNVCIPKNHVLVHFTPWKRHTWHFSCFFWKHDFELKFSLRDRFWIEKIQRVRFWI